MMTLFDFPPAFILLIGSLLIYFSPPWLRRVLGPGLPLVTLWHIWMMPAEHQVRVEFLDYTLTLMAFNDYTLIFATVFALAAFAGSLFSLHGKAGPPGLATPFAPRQNMRLEAAAAQLYAGSAIGVTFAGDLLTLFVFFELMALAATLVIWSAGTPGARAAGMRYALLHFVAGAVIVAGITGYVMESGSIALPHLTVNGDGSASFAQWLLLAGLLINAGCPPFSAWLPDAYPEASPSGAVFLSAFTTKTAGYVLLTLFHGSEVLIYAGLFMAFYGIIYAALENDIRRILAYSIINQVGFMLTGIGIGSELAMAGVAAHAFCHILYKSLLMMSTGAVLYMTGERRASQLGGLYRGMRWTALFSLIGSLSVLSFPLTAPFVSKSLLTEAAAHGPAVWIWFLLIAAAAGTIIHATVTWFVFFHHDSGLRPADPPLNMRLAMGLLALLCIIPGIFPASVYFMLPAEVHYQPNTAAHVVTQLQLVLFSALGFFLLLPWLTRARTVSLDFDWPYRVVAVRALRFLEMPSTCKVDWVVMNVNRMLGYIISQLQHIYGTHLGLSRSQAIGTTALWVAVLLGTYLALT